MPTLSDGTIQQTVHKQSGLGPYAYVCIWIDARTAQQSVTVFSYWEDASAFCSAIQANGHRGTIELAVDNMRRVPAGAYHLPALEVSL
jgi:hypothetical protein